MKDIVIVGSGGFARETKFLLDQINQTKPEWNFLGFVGSDAQVDSHYGTDDDVINSGQKLSVVFGVGSPMLINKLREKYKNASHITYPNLIHPNCIIDLNEVKLGKGNIICANNVFTVNISLGDFNVINLASTYGHDVNIGDCNVFNPGVNCSGGVKVGSRNLIGTGTTLLQNLSLGNENTLGAGAVLTKSYVDNFTLVGVPAKSF